MKLPSFLRRADEKAASLAVGTQLAAPAAAVRASVDAATVVQRFNFEWATDPDSFEGADTYWWWAASVRVDPNEVIAEDESGDLWSVPFTTSGEDDVTFGAPTRVRQTFVPVAAADGQLATSAVSRRRQSTLAAGLERPTKPSHPTSASADTPTQEDQPMNPQVRALLAAQGIDPDAATDEQITAATTQVDAVQAATTEPEPDPDPDDTPDPIAEQEAATVAQLSQEIADLRAREETRATAENTRRRDGIADAAVREGRFSVAERDHYRGLLDVDETRTVGLIDRLAAGRVPVGPALGRDSAAAAAAGTVDPEKRARVRASLGLKPTPSKES